MAEIILPPEENEETPQVPELNIDKPTTNSKVITIEFEAKKTNKVSTKDTNQQLYTTDTDAWFEFKETSLESANGTYSVVFRNRHDGSIFQRTGDVVNGVAYYKIPHQEIRHAGAWRGQIVYTLSNGDTTAREFGYDVKGHILDGKDVREIVVEDFETLMSQLRSMKDNAESELANLTQELENTNDTAEQNETNRQAFFVDLVEDIDKLQANYQELLDTGALQTNINTKLEALEEEYAPKLTEVTAQLAQIALPESNGNDDTSMINNALINNSVVTGLPGETYIISSSLVIPDNTILNMSGCKVLWKPGVSGDALITNAAFTPQRTFSDASITEGSDMLTSATAAFLDADVGRSVCVPGAGGAVGSPTMFTADIIEILSSTSVRLGKSAKNTVSNANARIHNRDKNISVKGGVWDRGNAVGSSGQRLHGLNFRHVENITVDIESYRSTQHGAKYAFLLGNARHATVSCRYMDTISDGVHLNGPCSFIDIPFLGGKTGDDFISLTGADYPHYADTAGDITDVNVGTIMIDDALAGYKILAGQGNYIDNFTAGNAYGSTRSYASWLGTDENYPDTMGGSYGKIDFGSIFIHSGSDLLRIVDATADIIKVKPKGTASIQLVRILENISKVGGVVNNLIIEEANIPNNRVIFLKEGANSILKRLTIANSFGDGSGYIANISGGIIEDFTIEKTSMNYTGAIAPIVVSGGVVNHLKLIDTDVDVSASTGAGALFQRTSGIGARKITLSRGSLTGAGSARGLIGYNPSIDPFEVVLDQVRLVSLKRLIDGISANVDVILINPQINTALEPLHIGNSALTTTITGTLAKMTGASTFLSSTSVGNIRANGITIPVRVSLLSPVEGDQVRNTDSSANSGWYLGVVAWDGGKWIPVRGYALHGNVTLQSGSVTISHNRITATSRIRLYRLETSGTPGALYVDSITPGTGFTIKSTNAGDTSTVRYEVVTY